MADNSRASKNIFYSKGKESKRMPYITYKTGNVPGAYGETDLETNTITINKKLHKQKVKDDPRTKKNKDGTANMLDTMVHEEMHLHHPRMLEKTVRRLTPKKIAKMSNKQKQKVYNRYS